MKYEQKVQVETSEYICFVKRIDGVVAQKTLEQELIRCKDCKFSMSGIDKYNERYILCQLHERSYGVIDYGFCNWAERKEE